MGSTSPRSTEFLLLENLNLDPVLVRRLPHTIASGYHAVLVAEDEGNGRVTVAMADPDDVAAREALEVVLDTPPYVVRAPLESIDALLAQVWTREKYCPLRVLVCTQTSTSEDEVRAYAQNVCELLGARVGRFRMARADGTSLDSLAEKVRRGDYELVILQEPEQSRVERLLAGPVGSKVVDRLPASLLIARRPRWPLERILLVILGRETDDRAADWVVRLGRPSGAAVTVLAVVPPVPAMYKGAVRMQRGLAGLLGTKTTLGRQMRRIARRLVDCEIEGTLRLREGPPDWQIRRELAEGDHDLIVITAQTDGWALRWLAGDVTAPLLRWADRPVLIARPKTG